MATVEAGSGGADGGFPPPDHLGKRGKARWRELVGLVPSAKGRAQLEIASAAYEQWMAARAGLARSVKALRAQERTRLRATGLGERQIERRVAAIDGRLVKMEDGTFGPSPFAVQERETRGAYQAALKPLDLGAAQQPQALGTSRFAGKLALIKGAS